LAADAEVEELAVGAALRHEHPVPVLECDPDEQSGNEICPMIPSPVYTSFKRSVVIVAKADRFAILSETMLR
jgi:hypothetical protein